MDKLAKGQESDPSDLSDLSDESDENPKQIIKSQETRVTASQANLRKNSFFIVNNALFIYDFVKNDEIIYCFLLILQIK